MVIVRRLAGLAVFVLVLVLGWKFADANALEVRLDYLVGSFENVKVWVLVLSTFAAGVVAGVVLCFVEMARLGLLSRRYRKAIGRLEAELHGLRSLPLSPDGGATARRPDGAEPGRDL